MHRLHVCWGAQGLHVGSRISTLSPAAGVPSSSVDGCDTDPEITSGDHSVPWLGLCEVTLAVSWTHRVEKNAVAPTPASSPKCYSFPFLLAKIFPHVSQSVTKFYLGNGSLLFHLPISKESSPFWAVHVIATQPSIKVTISSKKLLTGQGSKSFVSIIVNRIAAIWVQEPSKESNLWAVFNSCPDETAFAKGLDLPSSLSASYSNTGKASCQLSWGT